jgi:hypothetical protein
MTANPKNMPVEFLTVGSNNPSVQKRVIEIASEMGLVPVIPEEDIFRTVPLLEEDKNYRAELAANNRFTCVLADADLRHLSHVVGRKSSTVYFYKATLFYKSLEEEFGFASVNRITNRIQMLNGTSYVYTPEVIQVRPDLARDYGGRAERGWKHLENL